MHYLSLIFVSLPQLSLRLSTGSLAALTLYFEFLLFLFKKKLSTNSPEQSFSFSYRQKAFELTLFEGSPDIAALKEIFIDGEYEWDRDLEPKVIVDLGAHTGNTALYFHLKYPDARIYAVEASPKNYARLLLNTRAIPQIVPLFGAVSDHDGVLTFYESESSLGSSIHKREGASVPVEVPSFTVSTLFATHHIQKCDLMKIDIEGSEELLFADVPPESFSRGYIIEVHDDLMGISREEFLERFSLYQKAFQKTADPRRIILRASLA